MYFIYKTVDFARRSGEKFRFNFRIPESRELYPSLAAPTETLLIQTDSLRNVTENIKINKTFCFKTTPGRFGWCATCKVSLGL